MKKTLLIAVVSLIITATVFAQDVDKMPVIAVTGTFEVIVAPDEVSISLDVTKVDKNLQTAKRLNDESVAKILELARRFSVLPENIKTNSISVGMKYEIFRDPKK